MIKQKLIEANYKEFSPGYFINEFGLVFSIKSNKFIKAVKNMNGYMVTTIYLSGKRKKIYNHIKVVEMFGDCNGNKIYPGLKHLLCHGISIDHLDKDRFNPRRSNLEIVAHQLNCERKFQDFFNELGF